jgi:hypothetical protein
LPVAGFYAFLNHVNGKRQKDNPVVTVTGGDCIQSGHIFSKKVLI